MKSHHQNKIVLCILIVSMTALSACSSTRSEQGVTIEESRGLNPLNYIPGL